MAGTLALRFGASREQWRLADQKIKALAQRQDWREDLVFKAKLVVEELVLNIIDHGYKNDESRKIEVRLHYGEDALTIDIIDEASAFDPLTEAAAPNTSAGIDERPVGGLGVHLAKEMMDEVSYAREGNRNRLTLTAWLTS